MPGPPAAGPREQSPIVTMAKGSGRGLRRLGLLGAKWLGGVVRAIGRGAAATRDIDPAHRRDGIAFGLIALAVVCAIGTWLQAAGPVGGIADDLTSDGRVVHEQTDLPADRMRPERTDGADAGHSREGE